MNMIDIPGYEYRYAVTNTGEVYSYQRKRFLVCLLDANGYRYFKIRAGNGLKRFSVNRLVFKLFIGPIPPKYEVDHIDRNKSNDSVSNLRLATRSQNMANTVKRKGSLSVYKGVSWHKPKGRWQSRVRCDGQWYLMGYFDDEEQAALAYDAGAIQLFGAYALTNFI